MTTFLVLVAFLAAGSVTLAATGLRPWLRSVAAPVRPAATADPGLVEPDPRLPPVLLPDQVRPDDVGKLRFSVAFRGYRMDQVDAVLARLESVLAERDAALEKRSPRDPGAPA